MRPYLPQSGENRRIERIAVVGSSGSGKTTTARAIALALGIPHLELDSVFHQPGWTELPMGGFQDSVRAFTDQETWVVDGDYTRLGITDVVWPRADTVVWLDLPRGETLLRVVARTFRRIARREQLWNGNREGWHNVVDPRPENNIILRTWTRHAHIRTEYADRSNDPRWSDLTRARLTSQAEIDAFVEALRSW